MPKISLIVPVYNSNKYLKRCLESIEKQSYNDIEVIIVDDGSTDDSFEIMSSFSKNDVRFKSYKKKNGGVSSARNFGLSKAKGEWVAFVDSDDRISSLFCEIMYKTALENELEVVMCRRIDEKDDGEFQQEYSQKEYLRIFSFDDFIPTEEDFYGTCWGFLFKRVLIENTVFDETISFTEDALFSIEVMSKASRIGIVNEFLYYYNLMIHDSLSQGLFDDKKYTIITSRKRQIDLLSNPKAKRVMTRRLEDSIFYLFTIGRKSELFMENYYLEINSEFKKYFKYWSAWNDSPVIRKILLLSYYCDLEFGCRLHGILRRIMGKA